MPNPTHLAYLPSGTSIQVLNEDEVSFLEELCRLYTEQFAFTSISDIVDLDRLVQLELQTHRWGQWLMARTDYDGHIISESTISDQQKKTSVEIRQLKKLLGIDRTTREKAKGDGSVHQYIANLLVRAKEFDVHRDHQRDRALELANELIGMCTAHKNMTPEERRELHYTAEDLIEWVLTIFVPEFGELDEEFRTRQSTWIRTL